MKTYQPRLRTKGKRGLSCLLNLFFPPTCVGCGRCLPPFATPVQVFCEKCLPKFEASRWPLCVEKLPKDLPVEGILSPISLTRYKSHHTTGKAEQLIYHVKHKNDSRVFAYVTEQLAPYVNQTLDKLGVPCGDLLVTYPPRRPASKRKNGFDQAERLAYHLAKALDGELIALIERTSKRVVAQKKLNAKQRAESADASYVLAENAHERVAGRVVLLVDDLCTTGATLTTCGKLLIEAGALLVVPVTIGQTVMDA